ncbi:MAG: IPT/TIG domain-containing protein [Spirochaetales bacterium]|nr:IPT/TIG domain-containing protein [Spirochaetales bacterium]
MKKKEEPQIPFFRREGVIPVLTLFFVFIILILSTRFTGRPPQIEEITPQIGLPGDVMVIKGRFFGNSRNGGEVKIGGAIALPSDYVEWKNNQISVQIPDEAASGMVFVNTKNGRSNGSLFTNKSEIPIVKSGPAKPGEPFIQSVSPNSGSIGTLLTLSGINFGLEQGASRVYFTWIEEKTGISTDINSKTDFTPAVNYDFDYESWTDREVKVRVPDGTSSGNMFLETDKGKSNSIYFEVKRSLGTKLFMDKRTYSIQYSVVVDNIKADPDNGLYIWMPKIQSSSAQRNIKLISQDPLPLFPDINGTSLFYFSNLHPGDSYKISENLIFERYAVKTDINPSRIKSRYDESSRLYKHFTEPDPLVNSSNTRIKRLARSIAGKELNPYRRARLVYNYVRRRLKQSAEPLKDLNEVIDKREGNSYNYAILFCALNRALGIPSRPVGGIVIDKSRNSIRHFWAEFYIDGMGWLPVDPFLGDNNYVVPLSTEINPGTYFFGNLDNRHIAFSKGYVVLKQMNPNGRQVKREGRPDLQNVHEEAVGNIYSYSTTWHNIEILGIY